MIEVEWRSKALPLKLLRVNLFLHVEDLANFLANPRRIYNKLADVKRDYHGGGVVSARFRSRFIFVFFFFLFLSSAIVGE